MRESATGESETMGCGGDERSGREERGRKWERKKSELAAEVELESNSGQTSPNNDVARARARDGMSARAVRSDALINSDQAWPSLHIHLLRSRLTTKPTQDTTKGVRRHHGEGQEVERVCGSVRGTNESIERPGTSPTLCGPFRVLNILPFFIASTLPLPPIIHFSVFCVVSSTAMRA